MNESILIISNEKLQEHQLEELKFGYNVYGLLDVPVQILKMWNNINPLGDLDVSYLKDLKEFLSQKKREGCKYVYFKGDKGAEYHMVSYALSIGMVPLYATMYDSESVDVNQGREQHHICFRKYIGLDVKSTKVG